MAVFLRPLKIMNTVCGLESNTDREYTIARAFDRDMCRSSSVPHERITGLTRPSIRDMHGIASFELPDPGGAVQQWEVQRNH